LWEKKGKGVKKGKAEENWFAQPVYKKKALPVKTCPRLLSQGVCGGFASKEKGGNKKRGGKPGRHFYLPHLLGKSRCGVLKGNKEKRCLYSAAKGSSAGGGGGGAEKKTRKKW